MPFHTYEVSHCNAIAKKIKNKKPSQYCLPSVTSETTASVATFPPLSNIAPFLLICGQWFTPWKIQHAAPASEVIRSIQGEGWNGCWMPIPPIHHKERGSCATTQGHISGEVKNICLELNIEVMSGPGPCGHQQVVEGWKYHTWLSQQRAAGGGRRVVQSEISDNPNISKELKETSQQSRVQERAFGDVREQSRKERAWRIKKPNILIHSNMEGNPLKFASGQIKYEVWKTPSK